MESWGRGDGMIVQRRVTAGSFRLDRLQLRPLVIRVEEPPKKTDINPSCAIQELFCVFEDSSA
jgi:hypothetical protein